MSYLILSIIGGLLIWQPRMAKQFRTFYRVLIGLATLGAIVCARLAPRTVIFTPLVLLCVAGMAFVWQSRRYSAQMTNGQLGREVTLTVRDERLPLFAWSAFGPLAILWLSGRVTGLTIFGFELWLWLMVMGLAAWYGSRRSTLRRPLLAINIGATYFVALVLAIINTHLINRIPPWLILLTPLILIVPLLKALPPPSEPTPDECWKAGMIYYNPDDAALFVMKRFGIGYTFNFANRWSWVLILGLALILASVPLLLFP